MKLNRLYTFIEEVYSEGGRELASPLKRVAVAAVIENPFAGRFEEDLSELMETGAELGQLLGEKAVAQLDGDAPHSYGKAAIVGMNGEREHAAALMHPKLGAPLREAVFGGKAIIPSAKKMGGPGTMIDVPLHHKDAMKVRSHFDAMEVRIPDAPAANEIVVVIAVTNGGRPHPRVGGLLLENITGEDGLT
jgi:hypothetical protein